MSISVNYQRGMQQMAQTGFESTLNVTFSTFPTLLETES